MQGNSETYSEETDHQKEDQDESSTSAKRSYECTFCKRGFTNAQALGGHMNIHRKEKTNKAKQGTPPYSSVLPNMGDPSFIPQISSQNPTFYSIFDSQNCGIHFQPSTPYQSLNATQELSGLNLSLQIGPSYVTDDQVTRGINQKDGEVVDLELRLSHDPYPNYL